jgi:perosamine synthetase
LNSEIRYFDPIINNESNYWLNTIIFPDYEQRTEFLQTTNNDGILTRPVWRLMNKLEMYKHNYNDGIPNSSFFEQCVVNLPSSIIISNKIK